MLNCCVATQLARRAGHDWLISIDADELVCPDTIRLEPGHLSRCFESIAPSTQALVFLPIEVIGRRVEYPGLIFREETLFKNVFVRSETSGRLVPSVDLSRRIHDPIHDEHVTLPGYTGHVEGKSAVRLGQDVVPFSVHYFKGPGMSDLRQEQATWLLHYHAYSFSDFLRRNRNFADRPDYFVLGNTRVPWVPDRLFQEMVNGDRFDEDELRTYYTEWLSSGDEQIERMRTRSRDAVVEVTAVRDVFEKCLPRQADPLFL